MRNLYREEACHPDRVSGRVDDAYIGDLAVAVTGGLGGKVGVAPRVFPRKLVADALDRWTSTSLLYVRPLKALLNNLLPPMSGPYEV